MKRYLRERGINTTAYRKESLVKLATCACDIVVQIDPHETARDIFGKVRKNLEQLNFSVTDPFSLSFSDDLKQSSKVGLYDIFNYFISKRTDFDRKSTKAYKGFEDYPLFYDGHVVELKCCKTGIYCCYFARVRPTQRQKTYLQTDSYKQWVIADEDGDIVLAFCQCPGG